jgi:hypothetical protein
MWRNPGPVCLVLTVGNVAPAAAGLGWLAVTIDALAVFLATSPAWVGAATWAGTFRQLVRRARALRTELAGASPAQVRDRLAGMWKAWRSDELREARQVWRSLAESDDKFPTGTKLTRLEHTPSGRVLHVVRPGQYAGDLRKWEGMIAGRYAAGTAKVTVLTGAGGNAAKCRIHLTETDPFARLARKSIWPGYQFIAERGIGGYSSVDPMPVGLSADGQPFSLALKPGRSHRVIGTSGSGKGNYVLEELLWCLFSRDAWVYCIDFEGGEDFARLAPSMRGYWSRTNPNTPPAVLDRIAKTGGTPDSVLDLLEHDANARAGLNGAKQVTIGPDMPLLHLLIDGYHRLTAPQWDKVHNIVSELRKYGAHVTLLDQVGTKKYVAARPDTLSLCSGRIVFDTGGDPQAFTGAAGRYPADGENSLPEGRAVVLGFGTARNDPGTMVQTGWAGDGANNPRDPYTKWSKALVPFEHRWGQLTTLTSQKPQRATLTPLSEPLTPSPGQPDQQVVDYAPSERCAGLWNMLAEAGGQPVRQADIFRRFPEVRTTVKVRLRELYAAGVIVRTEQGRDVWWSAVTVPVPVSVGE